MVRAMLDAMTQDVDGAALGDLALQPREELAPDRAIFVQRQQFRGLGLGGAKERGKLDRIDMAQSAGLAEASETTIHQMTVK